MVAPLLRILLVLLLAAAQLAAPLVHAHVGGEAMAGKVHLPGLEALAAQPDRLPALADDADQELPSLAVGIATGLQSKQIPSFPCSQPALAVPPAPTADLALAPPPLLPSHTDTSPAITRPPLGQTSPRAPPSNPSI